MILDGQKTTKEKSKVIIYLQLIISIILFLFFLVLTILAPSIYTASKNVSNQAIQSQIPYILYSSSKGENKLNMNKVTLAKNIDQYRNVDDGSKNIYLLMLSGLTQVNIAQFQKIDNDKAFFLVHSNENFFQIYKDDLNKTSDADMEIYKKYLTQLVHYYKELPNHRLFPDNLVYSYINNQIDLSNEYINNKVLLSLYSLNNTIEHWREIKEINSQSFNIVDFKENPQEYWDKKFAKTHGESIPEYIKIYYDKYHVDIETAKEWIKNFK